MQKQQQQHIQQVELIQQMQQQTYMQFGKFINIQLNIMEMEQQVEAQQVVVIHMVQLKL